MRLLQCDDERVGVGGTEADGVEIGERAGGKSAGIFYEEKRASLGRRGGGREEALISSDELRGGDGRAVGPAGVGT